MIIGYKIVSSGSEEEIENGVLQLLIDEWIPQGGIAFIPETDQSSIWYAQAMVKDDGKL
jgi:hypothetical protein